MESAEGTRVGGQKEKKKIGHEEVKGEMERWEKKGGREETKY